jgi:F-type H+-transporting ATPase subunit delta
MKLTASNYAEALYGAVVEQPEQRQKIVARFFDRLHKDKAQKLLPLIVEKLEGYEADKQKVLVAQVASPLALTDEQTQSIQQILLKKYPDKRTIELKISIDPSLIGGIRLTIDDTVIDHSVAGKLSQLANRL